MKKRFIAFILIVLFGSLSACVALEESSAVPEATHAPAETITEPPAETPAPEIPVPEPLRR